MLVDQDIKFNRITHNGISKGNHENFEQWKVKLDEIVES
jgi:hypothetical protein